MNRSATINCTLYLIRTVPDSRRYRQGEYRRVCRYHCRYASDAVDHPGVRVRSRKGD